jgi:hypothetical protein
MTTPSKPPPSEGPMKNQFDFVFLAIESHLAAVKDLDTSGRDLHEQGAVILTVLAITNLCQIVTGHKPAYDIDKEDPNMLPADNENRVRIRDLYRGNIAYLELFGPEM